MNSNIDILISNLEKKITEATEKSTKRKILGCLQVVQGMFFLCELAPNEALGVCLQIMQEIVENTSGNPKDAFLQLSKHFLDTSKEYKNEKNPK